MKAYAQVRGSRDAREVVQPQTSNNPKKTEAQKGDTGPLFVVFFVVFILYAIVSAMLVYHWNRFGKNDKVIQFAQMVYFTVSLLLLLVAVFSII